MMVSDRLKFICICELQVINNRVSISRGSVHRAFRPHPRGPRGHAERSRRLLLRRVRRAQPIRCVQENRGGPRAEREGEEPGADDFHTGGPGQVFRRGEILIYYVSYNSCDANWVSLRSQRILARTLAARRSVRCPLDGSRRRRRRTS